jgi:acetyltransferase-like isoleucine patch superfamily enzyme
MQPTTDIFTRLRNGETVPFADPEYHKLRDVSFATRRLLLQLNQSADPEEIRDLLSRITGTKIDASSAIFPPFYVNYGRHTRIGKSVFINFDCVFLDFGGITIEDDVFIAPKVSLLTEGHPPLRQKTGTR